MLQGLRGNALIWAITFSSASCYLLFGYDQGVLGGLVTVPSFLEAIGHPSNGYLGFIVAIYNIGCLAGCGISGTFGNRLGRKRSILIGCSIMVVGGVIQTATYGSTQLIVGRIISGIGNGMNTSTIPVYVSETAHSHRRGRAVAVQLSTVIFGTVLAYWLDYGMVKNLTGDVVWRFPIAFQNVFALITIATLPFLPETPRWLYSHGRPEDAINVLARLNNCATDDPKVTTVVAGMEEALQLEHQNAVGTWSTIRHGNKEVKNMRRLILCFLIQMFQQFTGINVIAFYVTIVLNENVGLPAELSRLVAGCIQIAFWLGTLPPIFMLDKVGRRPILLGGSISLTICMVLFTVGIALNTPASANLALAMLFLYEISFGMSWDAIPWLYAPEITPLDIRHVGSAVAVFSEWFWTFVIVIMTPAAIRNTGWRIYILFCIMLVLSIPFTYFFLPETNGKTLEEIDYIFVEDDKKKRELRQMAYDNSSRRGSATFDNTSRRGSLARTEERKSAEVATRGANSEHKEVV